MDETPNPGEETPEVIEPEAAVGEAVIDLTTLDEAALQAEYDRLTEAIDVLRAEPRTIATVEQINDLRIDRNAVATAINALRSLDEVEDETVIEAAVETRPATEAPESAAPVVTEPVAAPVAETVAEPVEAPVAEPVAEAADEGETTTPEDAPTATPAAAQQEEPTVDDTTPPPENPSGADVVAEAEKIVSESTGELAVTAGLRPSEPAWTKPQVGYVAQGGQSEFVQGQSLDLADLGRVFESIRTRRPGPDGGPISGVAWSLPSFEATDAPVAPLARNNPAEVNSRLIEESVAAHEAARRGEMAVTAAICTPLDIMREVPQCGVTDMPFSNLFPQRPVGRLGFQYFPAMALSTAAGSVNVWTQEDQDAIEDDDSSTWKPIVDIECEDTVSVTAEELVAAARVDESTNLSQPETVEQFMHKLAVLRARTREQYLLTKFDATASKYTATYDIGAFPALLDAVLSLLPRLTYGERLDEGDYTLVLEPGHIEKLINDENAKLHGDTNTGRRSEILSKIQDETGMRVVFLRDFKSPVGYAALNAPNNAPATLPTLFDSNRVRLVPTSAYILGATGEQATGWQTDARLVRQNRQEWFSKEWILMAKHGCHPAATIDVLACGNGARAAGIEPADCTSSAS